MPIAPGTKLGQYEVQAYIGQGAMGVVYRAYHPQLARTGAVKVLQALSPDGDSTARFRREAQAIAQMRHPNILNVFDFGEFEGTPYMIVEFVDGGSLFDRIKAGPMSQADALAFLRGIATGLDHAHSLGIVHRDIKPANVLIGKNQTPILADFGLAKLMQSSSVKSVTGVTTGTPAYMAPEQVTGSQVGPAADNYSLATMAYELLTGVIPFEGEGVLELLYAHVHREPPKPSSRKPELGPRVDAVIMRGLAKDPETRWQSAEDFVAALSAAVNNEPEPAVRETLVMSPPGAAAATAPLVPVAVAETEPAAVAVAAARVPQAKSHRTRNIIIAAAAIVVLLVGGLVFAKSLKPPAPTFSLSSSTIAAGSKLVVSAHNLPANQVGEIQLFSAVVRYPFKADSQGNVSSEITIPPNITLGDHIMKVCWTGTCLVEQTLHITDAAVDTTPTPSSHPTGSPSPTHSPTAAPVVHATNPAKIGQPITVTGTDFATSKTVSVAIVQNSVSHQLNTAPISVRADGAFTFTGTVPSTLGPGPAEVFACSVTPGASPGTKDCAVTQITLEK